AALDLASARIRAFLEATRPPREQKGPAADGIQARVIWEPLRRVAVYVPAGRFPLCSSVLMGAIPAQVAGVGDVALMTPPQRNGQPDAATLAVAALLGIDEVYAVGGVQAIAAAAYGTETVGRVDAIVGPGNRYVTEAKRQVAGIVRIDGLNGPSEVVIWGDHSVSARQAALDLLAQAEHDPESWALVLSHQTEWLDAVGGWAERLGRELLAQPGVGAVEVATPDEAAVFVNDFAPEHLELWGGAVGHADRITSAGATFLDCPTPLGDYVAGPNHVLPTGGQARRASVLGVEDFLRRRTETRVVSDAGRVIEAGAQLARAEGLERHRAALLAFQKGTV
ncbi:MAG: histidinol dehydrogenase, partial [Clostridia bacterium]